jgi:hypothetical protein
VAAAVGILPYSQLPTTEHQDTIKASGAHEPPTSISIPYQMWYGTDDPYAGYPTTSGPYVTKVAMPGAGHSLPIPYNIPAMLAYLDQYAK